MSTDAPTTTKQPGRWRRGLGRAARAARRLARRLSGSRTEDKPTPPRKRPGKKGGAVAGGLPKGGRTKGGGSGKPGGRKKGQGKKGKKGGGKKGPGDARRIQDSPLFDHEWYALLVNRPGMGRRRAALHYLKRGAETGHPPHPLFDPATLAAAEGAALPPDRPALITYLDQERLRTLPTHPLFDTADYLKRNPAARKHPAGPVAHYVEFGAAQGLRPNSWYRPDPVTEPEGLTGWVKTHKRRLGEVHRRLGPEWRGQPSPLADDFLRNRPGAKPTIDHKARRPLVSVVMPAGHDANLLVESLHSLTTQTINAWQLVVVDEGRLPDLATRLTGALGGASVTVVPAKGLDRAAYLNRALDAAEGDFVAWLTVGETWTPERLSRLAALIQDTDSVAGCDGARRVTTDQRTLFADGELTAERILHGHRPYLSRFLVRRDTLQNYRLDESLPSGAELDLIVRLLENEAVCQMPVIGVVRDEGAVFKANRLSPRFRPWPDHHYIKTWNDVVVNERLLPWSALEADEGRDGVVSVVIPTYADSTMTSMAVEAVCAAGADRPLQVIVWDNGCSYADSIVLAALAERYAEVEVHHSRVNHGFALGNNLAVRNATGEHLVFLNNDTIVQPGWLDPLVDAVRGDVAGAQSLLLFADGTIQSAGIAFPSSGGLPHELLRGFPAEDAAKLEDAPLNAVTGAALCVRRSDFLRVGGFDPVFRNGMEDVDLCLRLAEGRRGAFRVVPKSRVVHLESQTPGRFTSSISNRAIFVDRWSEELPRDDVDLWRGAGVEVAGHQIRNVVSEDRRLCQPSPLLTRVTVVQEAPPRLRWAVKNPAPAGKEGEIWGDTHFARSLAGALRELGQEVVIDAREAWFRESSHLDDVTLALRGLTSFRPAFGQVNIGWMISHPETMSRAEACSYDRLFVASLSYPDRLRDEWGVMAAPLLQATDPERFNPDRARPDTGHQVLFVGGSRRQYRSVVRHAVSAGANVAIFGSEWEPFVPADLIKAQFMPNEELGAAYRSASLVLNDHWDSMRRDGFVSNRLFDAVASGARVLSDDVPGLEEIFGRSVHVVRSAADVAGVMGHANLDELFGTDDERRGIAERIAKEHCFRARAEQLLEAALEVRAAR